MSYSGGLVYVRDIDVYKNINVYDFNSMYPSVMRDSSIPYGLPVWTREFKGKGFYHCIVDSSNAKFLFLFGYNNGKKHSKASGVFDAYINDEEYRLALELGYKISIVRGLHFLKHEHIFNEFVNNCETIRLANSGNAVEIITKYLQNSLYGKFGSKVNHEKMIFSNDVIENAVPVLNDDNTFNGFYLVNETRKNDYLLPHFASYITANARVKLVRAMMQVGFENVIYADTDSLFVKQDASYLLDDLLGVEYGKLKLEAQLKWCLTVAPKFYFSENRKKSRVKGLPYKRANEILDAYKNGGEPRLSFAGLHSVRSMIVHGAKSQNEISRRVASLNNEQREKLLRVINETSM